jgi:hypothetical protein
MSDLTAPVLSHHFTSLIGRRVSFVRIPSNTESEARQVYGIYTNFPSGATVVVKSDLLLLGSFAGALVGLPDSEVRGRIRGKVIEELLRDAVYEVLNVASSVVATEGRATLSTMATELSEISAEAAALIAKPNRRIDFEASVDDYDGGRFTVLS